MTQTPRYALPYLVPGQLQKEITHNAALERVSLAVQPIVSNSGSATPPVSADPGECFLVGVGATGEWSGKDDAIAMVGEGGWIFLDPFEGFAVYDTGQGAICRYVAGSWQIESLKGVLLDVGGNQVVGVRQAGIAVPSGGSTKDTQARTAITDLIDRLVQHGLIAAS